MIQYPSVHPSTLRWGDPPFEFIHPPKPTIRACPSTHSSVRELVIQALPSIYSSITDLLSSVSIHLLFDNETFYPSAFSSTYSSMREHAIRARPSTYSLVLFNTSPFTHSPARGPYSSVSIHSHSYERIRYRIQVHSFAFRQGDLHFIVHYLISPFGGTISDNFIISDLRNNQDPLESDHSITISNHIWVIFKSKYPSIIYKIQINIIKRKIQSLANQWLSSDFNPKHAYEIVRDPCMSKWFGSHPSYLIQRKWSTEIKPIQSISIIG